MLTTVFVAGFLVEGVDIMFMAVLPLKFILQPVLLPYFLKIASFLSIIDYFMKNLIIIFKLVFAAKYYIDSRPVQLPFYNLEISWL